MHLYILDINPGPIYTDADQTSRLEGPLNRYTVTVARDGPLLRALSLGLPLLAPSAIRAALKRRDVLVNGQRLSGNVQVRAGDSLVLYTTAMMREVPVLYEDAHCLVVNKPAGLNADENSRSGASLLAWARAYAGPGDNLALVHRLDNQTSGLMVLARTAEAQRALEEAFRTGQVHKQYICLVRGSPQPSASVLTAWLTKDAQAARVQVTNHKTPQGKRIVTEYATLAGGPVSRLLVTLVTGRTHQIRAQLSAIGHPVLGDEVYGDRAFNRGQGVRALKLCATRLGFDDSLGLPGLAGRHFMIEPPF